MTRSTWVKQVILPMPTMKYATIVECRKCGRKGRWSAMVRHFRAKHVKPEHQRHYCTACDFGASRKRSMETHFLSKSHCRKAKGRGMAECFRLGSVRAIQFSDRREDKFLWPADTLSGGGQSLSGPRQEQTQQSRVWRGLGCISIQPCG